jgi:hypothetical protein
VAPLFLKGIREAGCAALIVLAATACRGTPAAFGATPEAARRNASGVFESMALSYTRVTRTAVAASARLKLGHSVLVPSRVFRDSTVWTKILPDSVRVLSVEGRWINDHYLLAERADPPRPEHPGDERREITLARIGPNDYQWTTSVESAMGSISVHDVSRVVAAMLSAAATTPGDALKLGSEKTFPRTASALGRLFSFDSVRTRPSEEGSTVSLFFGLHPDRLKETGGFPALAAYFHHYGEPSRLHFALNDDRGVGWFDFDYADNHIALQFRSTKDGHLAPISGPVRVMPDSLMLRTDFHTKVWLWAIGIIDLESGFTVISSDHLLGWHLTYRKEPKWHLPLAFLLTGSLRRPFAGEGAEVNLVFRDTTDAATLFVRDGRMAVEESTTMRWFGGIGTKAQTEFVGNTEAETYSFVAQAMSAIGADINEAASVTSSGEVDSIPMAPIRP